MSLGLHMGYFLETIRYGGVMPAHTWWNTHMDSYWNSSMAANWNTTMDSEV